MTIKRIEGIREFLLGSTGIMEFANQLKSKYYEKAEILLPGQEYTMKRRGHKRDQPLHILRSNENGTGTVLDPKGEFTLDENRTLFPITHKELGKITVVDGIDFWEP